MSPLLQLLLACHPHPAEDGKAPPDTAETGTAETGDTADTGDTDTDTHTDTHTEVIDADGDGSPADVDCDDDDPTVYPGAAETWYDGVDSDCGGDDDDDQDGDGHAAAASGGDDCDDTTRTVFPGAPEQCDPVDHDCDGVAMPDGVCAGEQDAAYLGSWLASYRSAFLAIGDDVTGDGVGDILATGEYVFPGTVVWEANAGFPARPGVFPDSAYATWYESTNHMSHRPQVVGDVDGDGYADVGIAYTDSWAGIALFFGPIDDDGALVDGDEPDALWTVGCPDIYCYQEAAYADFDGDGLGDAVSSIADPDGSTGGLYVFYGGEYWDYHDPGLTAHVGVDTYGDLYSPGDLDEDGYPDVILERWVIAGSALASRTDHPTYDEVRDAELEVEAGLAVFSWSRLPDLDADGVEELVLGAWTDEAHTWEALFFPPDIRGSFTVDDAIGGMVSNTFDGAYVEPCTAFGAGFMVMDQRGGLNIFAPLDAIPPRGTPVPERSLRITDQIEYTNCRDATGDGQPDIALHTGYLYDDPADRGLVVAPGFDLDWTNDALWAAP